MRLLQTQKGRVKLGIQRRRQTESESRHDDVPGETVAITASCYASAGADTGKMHAISCTPATFGGGLPEFSADGPILAHPVAIAQPLEYCTPNEGFDATGQALLVTRWFVPHRRYPPRESAPLM